MKLQLEQGAGQNLFTGYGEDYVAINREPYRNSLILLPDLIVPDWAPAAFEDLEAAHLEAILRLEPEVVLLGTGRRLRFPAPALSRAFPEAGIGLEVMDNFAACRTYNILMAEGRRVAAALIIAPATGA